MAGTAIIETLDINNLDMLQEGAELFFKEANLPGSFNMAHFKQCWQAYYSLGIGRIMVVRENTENTNTNTSKIVAALGCIRVPDLYTGLQTATELFWFVFPNYRNTHDHIGIKLFNAYEQWAKHEGCSEVRIIHLSKLMPERLKQFYLHRGYHELEIAYGKEVWQ